MEEKFWETGAKVVDFEDTKESSPSTRLLAKLICPPLFLYAVVVVPIEFLQSSDTKMILAGILFLALPYALVPLAIYGAYVSMHTDYTLRISTVNGTIEEIYTRKNKVKRTVYPIKEVLRISLPDPTHVDEWGRSHLLIMGMNIRGAKWSVDIDRFAWERYKQGKRSSDHKKIAFIKTAEYFAEMLDVEIKSALVLVNVSRDLREEFGTEWVHKWSDRTTIRGQDRRLLDEENKQRQKVQ